MPFVQRLRRYAPGLVGLALATVILWRGGAALEREAQSREAFSLRVAAPAAVVEVGDPNLRWRGEIAPVEERERVQLTIDERPVAAQGQGGELIVPLDMLRDEPGWHFVELALERRGGRGERIVDPILVGEFGEPAPEQKPCAALLSASPALLDGLLVPLLERELLPQLQANEHMGPDTQIREAKLELRDDGFTFELEIAGVNTLAVAGAIIVTVIDERRLHAELAVLTEADFRGKLRNQARGIGAGAGGLVGGLIAGPLAPVGAAAGYVVANELVTRKARELIRAQIEAGLAQLDGVDLLPTQVELVPGWPASRVAIGFCEQTRVRKTGIHAGLWITPDPAELAPRFELGVPGPLRTGATPTREPLEQGEDVRVELTIDAVNMLLTAWTQAGLLTELIGEDRAIARANVELEAWTPLRLGGLRPTRPPALTPIAGPEDGWRFGIGGLAIDVHGVDEAEQGWGEIFVAAAGELRPTWDAEAGALSLTGSLDTLAVTCAQPGGEGRAPILHGCFSEVLEAAEVRARIDEKLRPGAGKLPSIAVRRLLADAVGVEITALTLGRPRPGVLRLGAALRPVD